MSFISYGLVVSIKVSLGERHFKLHMLINFISTSLYLRGLLPATQQSYLHVNEKGLICSAILSSHCYRTSREDLWTSQGSIKSIKEMRILG